MPKFYTCRKITDQPSFSKPVLCLKPTVTDRLCRDHEDERAGEESRRARWPFWPGAEPRFPEFMPRELSPTEAP